METLTCYFDGVLRPYEHGGAVGYSYRVFKNSKLIKEKSFADNPSPEHSFYVAEFKALNKLLDLLLFSKLAGFNVNIITNTPEIIKIYKSKDTKEYAYKPLLISAIGKINKLKENNNVSLLFAFGCPIPTPEFLSNSALDKLLI